MMNSTNMLRAYLQDLMERYDLVGAKLSVEARTLSPEEAIGRTERTDYPLLSGKEFLMAASFRGETGQAFTAHPLPWSGTLEDLLALDPERPGSDALLVAAVNAVARWAGETDRTVHCRDAGPERCARRIRDELLERHPGAHVLVVGYQPAIIAALSDAFSLRVLDLDLDNVGKHRMGVLIEDGITDRADALAWADVVLATGSMAANGTIGAYVGLSVPVYFYGTTVAALASRLGLARLCYESQ